MLSAIQVVAMYAQTNHCLSPMIDFNFPSLVTTKHAGKMCVVGTPSHVIATLIPTKSVLRYFGLSKRS